MLNVGITGQSGFIGTHLFNFLHQKNEEINLIPFEDSFFDNIDHLKGFVSRCDAIVHLAAMNRHGDPQVIYDTNLRLVRHLIEAMDSTGNHPHILFSSSTQEEKDNLYGKSKREGRALFEKWAEKNNSKFTGFVIPNVFGPFGNPYYNSVIATFCFQLTHNEHPKIVVDANLQLIYVSELVELFYERIIAPDKIPGNGRFDVRYTSENKVSEILQRLENYKRVYFEGQSFPELGNVFELNLFNTFRSCSFQERSP